MTQSYQNKGAPMDTMSLRMAEASVDTHDNKTVWAFLFRLLAFGLAAGFWTYYVGRKPFDASAGWRYLTNWGLTLNLLVATWAVAARWVPKMNEQNPLLPPALTISSMVVILYWGLYIIDPNLVNSNGGLPWYSELYMHLGTTIFVYSEAFLFNRAPIKKLKSLLTVAFLGLAYILWVDQVVAPSNTSPCGLTSDVCGYPYPFLNDLTGATRIAFYLLAGSAMLGLSATIHWIWSKVQAN